MTVTKLAFESDEQSRRWINCGRHEIERGESGHREWIGDQHFHLFAGDNFRLEGELMRWRNPGAEPCEVVWVIAPPIY